MKKLVMTILAVCAMFQSCQTVYVTTCKTDITNARLNKENVEFSNNIIETDELKLEMQTYLISEYPMIKFTNKTDKEIEIIYNKFVWMKDGTVLPLDLTDWKNYNIIPEHSNINLIFKPNTLDGTNHTIEHGSFSGNWLIGFDYSKFIGQNYLKMLFNINGKEKEFILNIDASESTPLKTTVENGRKMLGYTK